MMESFMTWYFLLGLLTVFIGIYRYETGKQNLEIDFFFVYSWFIVWWVYIGIMIYNFIKKTINVKLRN